MMRYIRKILVLQIVEKYFVLMAEAEQDNYLHVFLQERNIEPKSVHKLSLLYEK